MFTIHVDSVGTIQEISFGPITSTINIKRVEYGCQLRLADSLFYEEISRVCRSCQWVPGVRKGRCASMSVDLPVVFILRRGEDPGYLDRIVIKDSQLPQVDFNHIR